MNFVDPAAWTRAQQFAYKRAFSFVDITQGAFPGNHPPYDDMKASMVTANLFRTDTEGIDRCALMIKEARAAGAIASGCWFDVYEGEKPTVFAERVHTDIADLSMRGAEPTLIALDCESLKVGKDFVGDAWHRDMTYRLFTLHKNKLFVGSFDPYQDGQFRTYYHRYGWHTHEQAYGLVDGVDGTPFDCRSVLDRAYRNPGISSMMHVTVADAHVPEQLFQLAQVPHSPGFSIFLTPPPGSPAWSVCKTTITTNRSVGAMT